MASTDSDPAGWSPQQGILAQIGADALAAHLACCDAQIAGAGQEGATPDPAVMAAWRDARGRARAAQQQLSAHGHAVIGAAIVELGTRNEPGWPS